MTVAPTDFVPGPLDRDATTYVAGHRGMVGSAVWRRLEAAGFHDLRGQASASLDLRDGAPPPRRRAPHAAWSFFPLAPTPPPALGVGGAPKVGRDPGQRHPSRRV